MCVCVQSGLHMCGCNEWFLHVRFTMCVCVFVCTGDAAGLCGVLSQPDGSTSSFQWIMSSTTVYIFIHGYLCVYVCASVNLVGDVVVYAVFSLAVTGERSGQGRERETASELSEKPVGQHFLMRPGTCPAARREGEREREREIQKLIMQFS